MKEVEDGERQALMSDAQEPRKCQKRQTVLTSGE